MTVSVSNEDDDEEDKRFAFSLFFVMKRCNQYADAACKFLDLAFIRSILSARDCYSAGGSSVPGTPGLRSTSARVKRELIC